MTSLQNGQKLISAHKNEIFIFCVVAQDGLRDFVSIMDAVDVVPENGLNCVIRIKTGVYDEIVTVGKKKCNVSQATEATTVVTGNRSNIKGVRTFGSATLVIEGDGFLVTGITFVNMVKPEAGQAVAVRISSYHTAFYRCRIADFQDTLYTQDGVRFFRECEIYEIKGDHGAWWKIKGRRCAWRKIGGSVVEDRHDVGWLQRSEIIGVSVGEDQRAWQRSKAAIVRGGARLTGAVDFGYAAVDFGFAGEEEAGAVGRGEDEVVGVGGGEVRSPATDL
ncbi:hypothetical protein ACLB2K_069666 [Fragaria x ananassa]